MELNGGKTLYELAKQAKVPDSELSQFGYYIALEAQGTGMSWWEDHAGSRKFKIPSVEFQLELEDPDDEDSAVVSWKRLAK